MKLLRSLRWPGWFLPVLFTLYQNNQTYYILARMAAIVIASVVAGAVAIFLPAWSMFVVLPAAWVYGAWWAGYRSDHEKGSTVGGNHDVYASCIVFMAVAIIRLGVWFVFRI